MKNTIQLYHDYIDKRGSELDVFQKIAEQFQIKSGLYPGSFVHITPSLVIPEMYYNDLDKNANRFFEVLSEPLEYVNQNKQYTEDAQIAYEAADFTSVLKAKINYYDLLISLYSGFISQHCKAYLKTNGILLVNDSHGDATLAFYDRDYAFIGVVEVLQNGAKIKTEELDQYFKFKRKRPVDLEKVRLQMKGPNYQNQVEYYLFRKIK